MPLQLVTPPAQEPVSLAEAKQHLRVDGGDDDLLIGSLITAARQAAETKTGRQLITARWKLVLDAFPGSSLMQSATGASFSLPGHAILLAKCPVQAVVSIEYLDMNGATQVIPAGDYVLDVACEPARLTPVFGKTWPPTLPQMGAVSVTFDAGYGAAVGGRDLPLKAFRRQTQMVFQDSYASLNPRLTIEDSVAFAPQVHGLPRSEAVSRARDLLSRVGLEPRRFAERYPHELSGGQRQRVNIARALALQPRLIILDEAVSALDKSVEAQVLNLLLDLKEAFDLTYIFISHDLNVVRFMSDRVMVMYLGQVVEIGDSEDLFKHPQHPYTRALLSSIPSMDPDRRTEVPPLAGDPPNPINPPSGCRFHTRRPQALPVCSQRVPALITPDGRHPVACLMFESGSGHIPGVHPVEEVA